MNISFFNFLKQNFNVGTINILNDKDTSVQNYSRLNTYLNKHGLELYSKKVSYNLSTQLDENENKIKHNKKGRGGG